MSNLSEKNMAEYKLVVGSLEVLNDISGANISQISQNIDELNGKSDTLIQKKNDIQGQITALIKGNSTEPSTPNEVKDLQAIAKENAIDINWTFSGSGLGNSVDKFIVQLSKDYGLTYTDITTVQGTSYKYEITYEKVEELKKWRIRVIVQNIYGKQSIGEETEITTEDYASKWETVTFDISAIAEKDFVKITINPNANAAKYGTLVYTVEPPSKYKDSGRLDGSGTEWFFDLTELYLSRDEVESLFFTATVTSKSGSVEVISTSVSFTPTAVTGYLGWTPQEAKNINVTTRSDGSGLDINWTDALNCCWGEHNHKVLVKYGDVERTTITTKDTNTKYLFNRSVDNFPSKADISNYTVTVTTINAESEKYATATAVKADAGYDYVGWDLSAPEIKVKATNDVASTKAKLTITNSVLNNDKFGLKKYEFTFTTSSTEETLKTKIASLSAVAVSEGVWEVDLTGKNLSIDDLKTVTVTCKVIGYIKDTSATSGIIKTEKTASGKCLGSKFNYDEYYDYTPTVPTLDINVSGRSILINFSHTKFANFARYEFQISKDKTNWYSFGSSEKARTSETAWQGILKDDTDVSGSVYSIVVPLEDQKNGLPKDTTYYIKARTVSGNKSASKYCDVKTVTAMANHAIDIAQKAVATAQLDDNAVTYDKIKADSIYGDKILGGTLSALSATMGQLQAGTISSHAKKGTVNYTQKDGTTKSIGQNICDRDQSTLYINAVEKEEEFYIGNVPCSDFEKDYNTTNGESYEGVWFNRKEVEKTNTDGTKTTSMKTNFVIKVANFIVTAVASFINGFFIIRQKDKTTKRLLIANPNDKASTTAETGEVVPANTVKVNGDITATGTIKSYGTSIGTITNGAWSVKRITVPNKTEYVYYVIPFGKIPDPVSTDRYSIYNWDRECIINFVRPAGHHVYTLHARAGHGYSHAWKTYCSLEQSNSTVNTTFRWTWKTYKVDDVYYLALAGLLQNNNYSCNVETIFERNLISGICVGGLVTLDNNSMIPVYSTYGDKPVYNSDIKGTLADVPSSWWLGSRINQSTIFENDVIVQSITTPDTSSPETTTNTQKIKLGVDGTIDAEGNLDVAGTGKIVGTTALQGATTIGTATTKTAGTNVLTVNGKATISTPLEVASGGTGYAKETDAINNLINNGCTTQTTNPVDDDYYICQFANGGTTTTTYHRRKTSSLWNYIKSKIYTVQTKEETSAAFDFDTYTTNGIYCPSGALNEWGTVTWKHAPTETPPTGGFTLRVYKEGGYLRQYLTLYNNNDTYTRYYYYLSGKRVWSPWTTIRPIDSSGNFSVTTVSATGKVMGVTISTTGKVSATGEVSGNTVTATGAVSGNTVTATGTVSGETVSGATVIASSYLRIPIGHSSTTYTNGEIWLT